MQGRPNAIHIEPGEALDAEKLARYLKEVTEFEDWAESIWEDELSVENKGVSPTI